MHPIFKIPVPDEQDTATKKEITVYQVIPASAQHVCSEQTITKYTGNDAEVLTVKRVGITDDGMPVTDGNICICAKGHLSTNVTLCKNCAKPICPKENIQGICISCYWKGLLLSILCLSSKLPIILLNGVLKFVFNIILGIYNLIAIVLKGISKLIFPFLWEEK
ncbi:MAG: hypothetical protein AB1571_02595 [Nanoarchaeota archaeon]